MTRAAFLDKDGTLIDDLPYNVDPDRIRLATGAGPALRALQALGFRLIVVSNQAGIALGRIPEAAMPVVHQRLASLLGAEDVQLDGFYYCPHSPHGRIAHHAFACACRKPQPGLLLRAAAEHGIDTGASWMIGDILDDVEAGRRAGCRTILINNGNETEWVLGPMRRPHRLARDLPQAAQLIAQYAIRAA